MKDSLSVTEKEALKRLESTIEKGYSSFLEVGAALQKIRDKRLYRANYKNFEDYLEKRWGISRPRAYQLIGYVKVQNNLSTVVDKPISERVARPFVPFKPEEQEEICEEAKRTAPKGKVTAKHVEKIVGRKLLKFLKPGKRSVSPREQIEHIENRIFNYSEDIANQIQGYVAHLVDKYAEKIVCIELQTKITGSFTQMKIGEIKPHVGRREENYIWKRNLAEK